VYNIAIDMQLTKNELLNLCECFNTCLKLSKLLSLINPHTFEKDETYIGIRREKGSESSGNF
jgi:hypothetical protein